MSRRFVRGVWISGVALLVLLALVPTAVAFEELSGERVVIDVEEVIEDDLYVSANTFVLDGTIKGDLIVMGEAVAINGTVEGDLMGGAQVLTINGTVSDDVRVGGAAVTLSEQSVVGGDVLAAGASLETKAGSEVAGDLLFVGYQALLAGEIEGEVRTAGYGLEIQGRIGGNVVAEVSAGEDSPRFSPLQFIPSMPSIPNVRGGLTIGEDASIGGDLEYTSPEKADVPAGVVAGREQYTLRAVPERKREKTPAQRLLEWILRNLRRLVGLIVVGLLLAWLVPAWLGCAATGLAERPWPALGLGAATFFGYPVAVLVFLFVLFMVALVLILMTLGNLGGALIWIGIAVVMLFSVAFGLVVTYVSKVVIGYWGGRLLLKSIKAEWADKPIWSMLVGVLIVALLLSIPIMGGALWVVITLFGMGAMWFLCLKRTRPQSESVEVKAE